MPPAKQKLDRVESLINEDDLPVMIAKEQMGPFPEAFLPSIKAYFETFYGENRRFADAEIESAAQCDRLRDHLHQSHYPSSHVTVMTDPNGWDFIIDVSSGATGYVHVRLTVLRDVDGPFLVGGKIQ